MADEDVQNPVNPLDAMAAAEEAALAAQTGPTTPHTAELAPEAETPHTHTSSTPVVDDTRPRVEAPAPTPPPAPPSAPPDRTPEAAPAEPKPPAETPPPAPPAEPEPTSEAWKAKRVEEKRRKEAEKELQAERLRVAEIERRNQELQAELERARQPLPDDQLEQPDPVAVLEQRVQQVEQQARTRGLDDTLNAQARSFASNHPDYEAALNYYVDSERREAELTGELDVVADRLRQVAGAQVRNVAIEQSISEAEAARNLATAVLFEARKQALVAGAQRIGKTVPEIIYERAGLRGYQRGANGGANGTAAAQAAARELPSAAEQVRTEQTAAATASLAGLATSSASPPPSVIRTRADFAALPAPEQERYIERMDRERPGWERDLL